MQTATAEKCENKWQMMNLQLHCILSRWEHSGPGDGRYTNHGVAVGDDDGVGDAEEDDQVSIMGNAFSSSRNHSQLVLDQQRNFID